MRWISETVKAGGRIRLDTGFTSIDDIQLALASYLICRSGAPSELTTWPSFEVGSPIPGDPKLRLSAPVVSLFPRFIHDDDKKGLYLLCAPDVADGPNCPFDCSPTGFAFAQTPSAINPVIVQDVLGGPFARAGGGSANTWLRLLLDLELGLPLGYGRRGPMYFARFEFGEAVVYPFPDGLALNEFALRRYRPILPNNQTGMYLTIDADAIDALVCGEPGARVCGGPAAVAALQGHLPGWALSRHFDLPRIGNHRAIEANPGVLRRALEAGLQDAGEVEADQPGTPGICLRTIGAAYPDFPMLPGMGRVVFYSGGAMGQRLSRQFPAQVAFGPRRVPQSVAAFLARNPSQGASLRITLPGTGGVLWNRP